MAVSKYQAVVNAARKVVRLYHEKRDLHAMRHAIDELQVSLPAATRGRPEEITIEMIEAYGSRSRDEIAKLLGCHPQTISKIRAKSRDA